MKKTNLIFGLAALLIAGSCKRTPTAPVLAEPPAYPGSSFSWEDALDKQVWVNFASGGYDQDTLIADTMYALWKEKSRTASRFRETLKSYALPDSSIFYEYVDFGAIGVRSNRALALWIRQPRILFVEEGAKGCEAELSGLGEILGTRALLLLDTRHKHVLQKLDTLSEGYLAEGFYAPFASTDLKIANALHLLDLDGDGVSAELLFQRYEACGVYRNSIVAYDADSDRLVQRPFRLKVNMPAWAGENLSGRDTSYTQTTNWVLDFPLSAIGRNGQIQYKKDVGHGSDAIYHYDFQFDRETGYFEGTLVLERVGEK